MKLGTSNTTTDTAVAAGAVVEQAPAGGTEVEKGSAVAVTVSAKAETIAVPDVTSKDASAAADAITAAGLVPVVYRDYNAAPSNTVFAQVPTADDQVAPGTTVAIGVSSGKAPTNPKVPNVVGKTKADATSALEKAGFKAQAYESYNATVAAGKVFAQFPAANTQVLAGSTVGIGVSKGKAPAPAPSTPSTPAQPTNVKVPNVTGKTEAQANSTLKNAGLAPTSYQVFSDTVAKGTVVAQLPGAGSSVAKGTVIGIAVSQGKAPASVKVPNLVGKTVEDAYAALEQLGLVPVGVPEPDATEPEGTVTDQLPDAGASVAPNSRVVC